MTDQPLVQMQHIEKYYGRVHALRDVNLTIRRGEIVGLLGDNGAGKSTLINRLESNGQVLLAVNAEAIQKSLGPAHWALAESPPSRR